MRIGIIAEGRFDLAVISNLVKAVCNLDQDDIQYIQPEYSLDETDLAQMREEQFGSWTLVRKECQEKSQIDQFFKIEGNRFIIIHLDADVCEDYEVQRQPEDLAAFRQSIEDKIKAWLDLPKADDQFIYAVAIQATESWVLAIYLKKATDKLLNPKDRLDKEINNDKHFSERERNKLFALNEFDRASLLSKDFKKRKTLNPCLAQNASLNTFVETLHAKTNLS